MATTQELLVLEDSLLNENGTVALHDRFRALFTLKALKSDAAVDIISKGFKDQSALLKHELAYCLGQMGRHSALSVLESVLRNEHEDVMVRHEAAEAMGAISSSLSIPILKEYVTHDNRVLRETCQIAISKIEWNNSEEGKAGLAANESAGVIPMYTSVDPAPPLQGPFKTADGDDTVASLQRILMDTELSLFERYRAMFALRDIGTPDAVHALAAGFMDDSALFKHEVAFVFGQLLSSHAVPSLLKVLHDTKESDMVRHEAAEALGGIATPEVLPHLKEWLQREDSPVVVRESCQVAIDMWNYENSDEFQYANALEVA